MTATRSITALTPDQVDELVTRVETLPAATSAALDRDTALVVLRELQHLQRPRPRRRPAHTSCSSCGGDLGGSRPSPEWRPPLGPEPALHPDPIGAADGARGARLAARALGDAMLWRRQQRLTVTERLVDGGDFWTELGCGVLWPLLLVARATGRDMDDVAHQADHLGETLAAVACALEADGDAVDARRQWA